MDVQQRNNSPLALAASTPLLSHPRVTYDSLADFCCLTPSTPQRAAPAADATPGSAFTSVSSDSAADEDDTAQQLAALPVPYSDLLCSGVLTEAEVDSLRALFDRSRAEERALLVRRQPAEYASLFHRLLSNLRGNARLQGQVVVALHTLFEADDAIKRSFSHYVAGAGSTLVTPLMQLLLAAFERTSDYRELPPYFVPSRLCDVLTALLEATLPSSSCSAQQHWSSEEPTKAFIDWLVQHPLRLPPAESSMAMLAATFKSLRSLVWFPPLLAFFVERDGMLRASALLVPAIEDHTYQYNLAHLLWLCCFDAASLREDFLLLDVVPLILSLLSSCALEKCIRLYLRVLLQMTSLRQQRLLEYLVEAALPDQLDSLSRRRWRDPDVVELIAALRGRLDSSQCELTTWSRYRAELLSAALHPSPPHFTPSFFGAHLEQFAANHAAAVRRLLGALCDDRRLGAVSRAMAAWDLGEIARCGSAGKRLLLREVSGVKEALLRAASSEMEREADVRRAALVALQKLIVPRWDELERQCRAGLAGVTARSPLAQMPEDGIGYALQAYRYKCRDAVGGWPG